MKGREKYRDGREAGRESERETERHRGISYRGDKDELIEGMVR